MESDRYGLPLTTGAPAAAAAWRDGADRFLAADGGALEAFERAIAADPGFAMAHAGRARVLQVRALGAEAKAAIDRAGETAAGASERERGFVDIVAAMLAGDGAGALARIRDHAARYPRDAMALQPATNVFGLIGFSGRAQREQEVFDLLAPLAGEYGDDWWYTGTLGFWHTELGRPEIGLEMNRQSVAANPRNANAAHGLAHAWYELGDDAAGLEFLDRFVPGHARDGNLHCHLSWHRALFALGLGEVERMWSIYADAVAPAASPLAPPINTATDSASLLWRAGLFGTVVDAGRWREIAEFARDRFPPASIAFLDAHRAIAGAMAGDGDALAAIVAAMREADAAGRLPNGAVAPDAIEGMAAFARGDDAAAIAALEPRLDDLVRVGGSLAQRDLFVHTLLAAYLRAGRRDDAAALAGRVPWRAAGHARALLERAAG